MRNVISIDSINDCSCDLLANINDGSNTVVLEIKADTSKDPRLEINSQTVQINSDLFTYTIDQALYVGTGILQFRIVDDNHTGDYFSITKISGIDGNLYLNQTSNFSYYLTIIGQSTGKYLSPDDVDSALSDTSENPVQNKVVTEALNGKAPSDHNHDGRYYTESEINTLLSAKANTNNPRLVNPTLQFLLGTAGMNTEFRRSGSTNGELSIVFTTESGSKQFHTLIDDSGDFKLVTKDDYLGYKQLWTGSATQGNSITVNEITDYITYVIIASAYPMALFGVRWGSSILASGIDANSDAGFRVASIRLTVGSNGAITVTRSRVANMAFGAQNGTASNFTFTHIYGLT